MSELYQIPDDIRNEFVITVDGRVFAKSWSAVARLAGVRHQTIIDRLLPRINTVQPEALPSSLRPLSGMGLTGAAEQISDVVVSCIVNYYAWESPQGSNGTAKAVALAFNACGIRGFFQREYGWQDPKNGEILELKTLMFGMMNQLLGEIAEMKSDLAAFKSTGNKFPGITNIVNNTNNNNVLILPPDFKEPFSIRDWVRVTQNRVLTNGECKSIGRMVSGTMTTLKLESPIKYATGKVYRYCDMPALVAIYQSWEMASKK